VSAALLSNALDLWTGVDEVHLVPRLIWSGSLGEPDGARLATLQTDKRASHSFEPPLEKIQHAFSRWWR
jgi:hypothetical protein